MADNGKKVKGESKDYFEIMRTLGLGTDVITEFLGGVAEIALKEEGLEGKLQDELDPWGVIARCNNFSFAVGYIFGQDFKICDPEVIPVVAELRQRLIDEKVLSFTSNAK